jgi:shikimate dehydrogenase
MSTTAPDRYAVIGHPIAHSRSPWIHARFAAQTGQHLLYTAIDAAPEELAASVRGFFAQGGRGLNVTVPHKLKVMELLDGLSERARIAGAVNTVIGEPDGRLCGDNTDGIGFVRDLTHNLQVPVAGRRLLLLGAGGAARGLLAPLLALEPALLVIANRSPGRARELAAAFTTRGPVQGTDFAQLESQRFDLIINATAASLHDELPPLPPAVLASAAFCYDLVYAHGSTPFTRRAGECGVARCSDGAGMLVEQAAESFLLWRGIRPQTSAVIAALTTA